VNVARATALFFLGVLSTARAGAFAWIVPGVANVTGRKAAEYRSEVSLSNPGSLPVSVKLSLIPAPDTPRVEPLSYTVDPGTSISTNLETACHLRGTGALRIESDARIDIFARTYLLFITVLPLYGGSSLPVIEESQLLVAGEAAHSALVEQSNQPGEPVSTNVAVAFPAPAGGTAEITLYSADGSSLGSAIFDSPVPEFLQRNVSAFTAPAVTVGRVAIRVTRGTACGYTALVGAGGDVSILAAERLPPAAASPAKVDLISVGIAQTPGQIGSLWQSDVRVANPGANAVGVAAYLLRGPGVTAGPSTFSISAGQTIEARNLVQSLFNVSSNVTGSVLWRADGPVSIATFTGDAGRGRWTGASRNALPLERFSTSDDPLPGLTDLRSGEARANLLAVAGPEGATLDLDAFSRDGQTLGSLHLTLPALGSAEFPLSNIVPVVSPATRLQVRVGFGSVHVEAAVVGSFGGDLLFQEASPRGSVVPSGPLIPAGNWGGANGMDLLSVDSVSIQLFRFCQKGVFPQPLRLDSEGSFAVLGSYRIDIGPAIGGDVILAGQLKGQTIRLRVLPLSDFGQKPDSNPETFTLGAPFTPFPGPCPVEN